MGEPREVWDELLAAAAALQRILPGAVLVGGTAAAIHVRHRISHDADHVLTDLRERFESVLHELEADAGWTTARMLPPVLVLGSLHGVETGIRQLRRSAPLEVETVLIPGGDSVLIPTAPEMLRIKAWLLATRNTQRDLLDVVALSDHLGDAGTVSALASLDSLYQQDSGESVAHQLVRQLAEPHPVDAEAGRLSDPATLFVAVAPEYATADLLRDRASRLAGVLLRDLAPRGLPERE
jgi:hypothetical protein